MYKGEFNIYEQINNINTTWKHILKNVADKHADKINNLMNEEIKKDPRIFPEKHDIFNAFKDFNFEDMKFVLIGQDPYHTPGAAHGLCFSVPDNYSNTPPSLRNIFNEIEHEFNYKRTNTNLTDWKEQGGLLLNTSLTVTKGKPGSHVHIWNEFVCDIISYISEHANNICFIMWGNHAISFEQYIKSHEKHCLLKHSHPSPMCKKPFVGCNHFRICNEYLESNNKTPIKW